MWEIVGVCHEARLDPNRLRRFDGLRSAQTKWLKIQHDLAGQVSDKRIIKSRDPPDPPLNPMQFVRKACDNKGCKCLSWPCSPIVTLALRFDLQCKEYKHDGTQTTFRHCKSWKAVEIDCHSFYHSLIFETMCLTVFQTTIACQNDPK